jgi:hypothetical protein
MDDRHCSSVGTGIYGDLKGRQSKRKETTSVEGDNLSWLDDLHHLSDIASVQGLAFTEMEFSVKARVRTHGDVVEALGPPTRVTEPWLVSKPFKTQFQLPLDIECLNRDHPLTFGPRALIIIPEINIRGYRRIYHIKQTSGTIDSQGKLSQGSDITASRNSSLLTRGCPDPDPPDSSPVHFSYSSHICRTTKHAHKKWSISICMREA